MFGILRSIRFLVMAPFILGFLAVVNLMTSPGVWWVQWAALGLGIAWFINLFRLVQAVVLAGGLAALGYYLWNRFGDRIGQRGPQGWAPQQQDWAAQPRTPQAAPLGPRLPR